MAVCRDARLASVVLASPAVRFKPWVEQRAVRPRIRGRLQSVRELCERMNLTLPQSEDDVLILASTVVIDMVCHGDRKRS
jgi:hypothetical protein